MDKRNSLCYLLGINAFSFTWSVYLLVDIYWNTERLPTALTVNNTILQMKIKKCDVRRNSKTSNGKYSKRLRTFLHSSWPDAGSNEKYHSPFLTDIYSLTNKKLKSKVKLYLLNLIPCKSSQNWHRFQSASKQIATLCRWF